MIYIKFLVDSYKLNSIKQRFLTGVMQPNNKKSIERKKKKIVETFLRFL